MSLRSPEASRQKSWSRLVVRGVAFVGALALSVVSAAGCGSSGENDSGTGGGGKHEVLLDVPQYDFNWQNSFVLAQPKRILKGSKLRCTAYYDNSSQNLANPDPSKTVRWGEQTWDEMMIGWHDVAAPIDK